MRDGESVLEIGGGIGEIEIELLRAGADRATNVELSRAYEQQGLSVVEQAGLEGRIEWRYGDIAADPSLAPPADVVVLNRVVCCYPDMPALVGAATDRTRRALALSFPRDLRLIRAAAVAINLMSRIRRSDFRFFVHSPERIVATAREGGLSLVHEHRGRLWQIAELERA